MTLLARWPQWRGARTAGWANLPLLERKQALRRILPRGLRLIEEALCVPNRGLDLFRVVEEHDLEGVIAKRKDGPYATSSPWLKIKNPRYTQAEGRGELFRRSKGSRRI